MDIPQCSGTSCMELNSSTSGIVAAVTAPFLMTLGFLVWDVIWKRAGGSAFALNLFKCNLASIAFLLVGLSLGFVKDGFNKEDVSTTQSVGFLILSSVLGILIGDTLWLAALTEIGAARVLVVDAIKPSIATVLGRLVLGEKLHPAAFGGVALTVIGILVVSLEKEKVVDDAGRDVEVHIGTTIEDSTEVEEEIIDLPEENSAPTGFITNPKESGGMKYLALPSGKKWGYFCAMTNVVFDAYGSLLTKQHGVGMTTWGINLVRFGFAGVTMAVMSSIMYLNIFIEQKHQKENVSDTETSVVQWYLLPSMKWKAWFKISAGVGLVTFLCPALSNFALFQIPLALAITLGSVTPLYALILEWPLKGRRPTMRSIVGAILAVGGVVVLSVWKSPT